MWVYGKSEPGWYIAASVWSDKIAEHWRSLGYEVSQEDPRKAKA